MMAEILLAIVVFALLIAAMAIGVIMGGKPIAGSCGGVGAALGEDNYSCDICGGDSNKCDEKMNLPTTSLGYNAAISNRDDSQI